MVTAQLLDQPPGCILTALRVRHEDADTCARKLAQLNEILVTFDGFASLDTIRREGGLGTDFYILARFRDVAALERWRALPDRNALMDEIEAMSIADVSRQQAAGSNIWFEPIVSMPSQPKPPLLWKRWATSMLAVYPALIVLVTLLRPVTAPLPEPLGLLVVALILTGLTTAFIVPWLTRVLHRWLVAR
ncbi:hypothetical protein SAMN05216196_10568 [Lutimaribacter pacificus]|uniref:ABM domain-containing protein n=1 Tax=Lutimaribacter pacificus TaxID=391948 RepID=A0A1H0IYI0_9RHOB|nr:antibiotic biosynthesis monooxygenase [Lutimaribacter pacificus]SDO36557.1 hypothetical protein SAMN05216196_10568 [Lutimaribacter pacificus]SHK16109.1 hypothetical protein SAMN05444142_103472 [Lutimaribacter pacificus]